MMEKRMEDMIHETLEGGGGTTQAKGNDQELIETLMSFKVSLGNVISSPSGSMWNFSVLMVSGLRVFQTIRTCSFIELVLGFIVKLIAQIVCNDRLEI
jgi:hypothetical protein